jgi:hypothetical protein
MRINTLIDKLPVNGDSERKSDLDIVEAFPVRKEIAHTLSPGAYEHWRQGRPYTKRWSDTTREVDRASRQDLSWRAKATYHALQDYLGHADTVDIPGVLIKDGERIAMKKLARKMGRKEKELSADLHQLIEFGPLSVVLFKWFGDGLVRFSQEKEGGNPDHY